jgi:hypothetical protein
MCTMRKRKQLEWARGDLDRDDRDDRDASVVESSLGDGEARQYRLFYKSDKWLVTLSCDGHSGALARGWALTQL